MRKSKRELNPRESRSQQRRGGALNVRHFDAMHLERSPIRRDDGDNNRAIANQARYSVLSVRPDPRSTKTLLKPAAHDAQFSAVRGIISMMTTFVILRMLPCIHQSVHRERSHARLCI